MHKIKITVEDESRDKKLVLTTSGEDTMGDWKDNFSAILLWLTYHPDTIATLFCQEEDCKCIEDKNYEA